MCSRECYSKSLTDSRTLLTNPIGYTSDFDRFLEGEPKENPLPAPEMLYNIVTYYRVMAGSMGPRPPLPDWILECYECLLPQMCSPEDEPEDIQTIDRDEAVDLLLTDCETPLESEDATYALEHRIMRLEILRRNRVLR